MRYVIQRVNKHYTLLTNTISNASNDNSDTPPPPFYFNAVKVLWFKKNCLGGSETFSSRHLKMDIHSKVSQHFCRSPENYEFW